VIDAGLETSNPKGIPSPFPHPPPSAPQPSIKRAPFHLQPHLSQVIYLHFFFKFINNHIINCDLFSGTLKVRICSKSQTNSAPTFIVNRQ